MDQFTKLIYGANISTRQDNVSSGLVGSNCYDEAKSEEMQVVVDKERSSTTSLPLINPVTNDENDIVVANGSTIPLTRTNVNGFRFFIINELFLTTMLNFLNFEDVMTLEECVLFDTSLRDPWLDAVKKTIIDCVETEAHLRWSLIRSVRVETLRLTSGMIDYNRNSAKLNIKPVRVNETPQTKGESMKNTPQVENEDFNDRICTLLKYVKKLEFIEEHSEVSDVNGGSSRRQYHRGRRLLMHRDLRALFDDGPENIDNFANWVNNRRLREIIDFDDDDDNDHDAKKHDAIVQKLMCEATNLEELLVSYIWIGVENLRFSQRNVSNLSPNLRKLTFDGIGGTDGDDLLAQISTRCTLLKELSLCNCFRISIKGIEHFLKAMPKLKSIDLENCRQLGRTQMDFSRINNLTQVSLKPRHLCKNCFRVVPDHLVSRYPYLRCAVCVDSRLCVNCHTAIQHKDRDVIELWHRMHGRNFTVCRGNKNRKDNGTGKKDACKLFCCDECTELK